MVIIDTGPIVSIFDESEPMHEKYKATFKTFKEHLLTTWPVLTESFYLLRDWDKGHKELWIFIIEGGILVIEIHPDHYMRLRDLMSQYSDRPMDIADATLIVAAEINKIKTIFTLDRNDFSIYRPSHCKHLNIVPE
jgi:predicted nucleic acid-binding protein